MASCGVRDVIKFLVKNRMVDCIVATAGGIEEDFIKCLAPTYIGKEIVKNYQVGSYFSLADSLRNHIQSLSNAKNDLFCHYVIMT